VTVNLHDVDDRFAALNGEVAVCTLCDLAATRTRAVPGEGSSSAEVMFIGEGPGQNEDKQGRPFVGAAGQFLNELISIIGLDRRQVYITNVVKCRPPQNRDPLPNELAACRPYLDRQIAMMNPRVIVTLGRYSLGTFFPGEFISRIHGSIRKIGSRYYYPMYHPASALYQQSNRQMIIDDMKKLGRWLEETSSQAELITPTERGPGPNEATEEEPSQLSLF
jgi:uracil-DNA glycosylase